MLVGPRAYSLFILQMARRNKFGAKKTTVNGIIFSSKGESERYSELRYAELAGIISDLQIQYKVPVYVRELKAFCYVADYFYFDSTTNTQVIEDYKGVRTAIFNLKWKIVKALHPEWEFRISRRIGNRIIVVKEEIKKPPGRNSREA